MTPKNLLFSVETRLDKFRESANLEDTITQCAPQYLLIVGCSQRKRATSVRLPAIERYDGVNYRVLRKAKREGYWSEDLQVLIISAKYGLLKPDFLIENYDQRMTREQALELQPKVSASLDACLSQKQYREVFVNLGKAYLIALAQSEQLGCLNGTVYYSTGGIGKKMSQMKSWLHRVTRGDCSVDDG